jgi:hypothetical protein
MASSDPLFAAIEADPRVRYVAGVLAALQRRGLRDPAVASGFIRAQILGMPPTDVDIHYVGDVSTATAEAWLHDLLAVDGIPHDDWDIWNFTEHDPHILSTDYGYLVHFVSTIDCIALGPDGTLRDVTGRGAADARGKILHFSHLEVQDYPYKAEQLCYIYTEGLRRVFLYDLAPDQPSAVALRASSPLWHACAASDRRYLRDRLRQKLSAAQREAALPLYAEWGWATLFEMDDPA